MPFAYLEAGEFRKNTFSRYVGSEIKDFAASVAFEMAVSRHIDVITDLFFLDDDRLNEIVLEKKFHRVVHRGARQSRNFGMQTFVNIVRGRMNPVIPEEFINLDPLY